MSLGRSEPARQMPIIRFGNWDSLSLKSGLPALSARAMTPRGAHALPHIVELLDEGVLHLLSIMDHTPGQGQFRHLDGYVAYLMGNHGTTREAALQVAEDKLRARESADDRVLALMERAHRRHQRAATAVASQRRQRFA